METAANEKGETTTMRIGYKGTTHTITEANANNEHGTDRLYTACGTWFAERVADFFPKSDTHTDCPDCPTN